MCMSCLSSAEAVVINATGGLVLAKSAVGRVGDVLAGRHPVQRRQAAWDANAAFLQELGLDPEAVLGGRPVGEPVAVEVGVALA